MSAGLSRHQRLGYVCCHSVERIGSAPPWLYAPLLASRNRTPSTVGADCDGKLLQKLLRWEANTEHSDPGPQ